MKMDRILLNDLLQFLPTEINKVRIKFNIYNGSDDPLELYKEDPDAVNITWFLWHDDRRYFHTGQIAICLLKIAADTWLLTTIKEIQQELDVTGDVGYVAQEIEKYKKYFGRVLIKYHNTKRTMGRSFESIKDNLEVLEILNDQYTGDDFPGYENVRLSYGQLKTIVERKLPGWIAALRNQKAVYLITDKETGKLYVGSATSKGDMLLERWTNYVHNGHGGNVELKALIATEGFDYVKNNFQYSILENFNARMDDSYILKREAWWKETLCSKSRGYNGN